MVTEAYIYSSCRCLIPHFFRGTIHRYWHYAYWTW